MILTGNVALEKCSRFPKTIHRRQMVQKTVTIFIKADDPFIIWEPTPWNRTGCAGPIPGLIGEVVGVERAFGRAATFALAAGLAIDGFCRLFPDISLKECLVFHGTPYRIYGA
jgi:hypothetical protein